MWSFRGSYANHGSEMQQASSDVVRRARVELASPLRASAPQTDVSTISPSAHIGGDSRI